MSSNSLNRLTKGGGLSSNQKINAKYATMWKLPQERAGSVIDTSEIKKNQHRRLSFISTVHELRRHQRFVNRFRGIKKEELDLQASIIICSMTLEELYEEIIFETLHNIGREDEDLGDEVLFRYLQDCFKFPPEKHEMILDQARNKEAPEIRLNVEVIEAKDLKSMDPNGLSDPFVTLYIESNPSHRYNTSVKSETLTPKWEEHFSLPISEDPNNENLIIEVYDFDPAETVREKVAKVFDVKGAKGVRKLLKEIAVTSYAGSHKNELIGKTYIPLKTIPASGLVMWYSLDKKGKKKRTGLVKIRINFSSEKNTQVAMQEHRHLLKILLLHELETSQVAKYWWSGKFSSEGETILTQHAAQSGLTQSDLALSRWSVFCEVHSDHPLAFSLFDGLLDKIVRTIQSRASEEEVRIFWESTKKLLPSCMNTIRRIRKSASGDKNTIRMVAEALSIISKIAMIVPPEGFDLFPANLYGWLPKSDTIGWDIRSTLTDAVRVGAEDWFLHITEQNPSNYETNEERLQHLVKIIQLVRSDLQRSIEYYDKIFKEIIHFQYTKELYNVYESLLADMIEPEVLDVCRSLKRIHLQDDQSPVHVDNREINMGTTLFELYLVLKRFVVLGTGLTQTPEDYKISNYYQWFTAGVSHWLDISLYKAMTRIKKAIELDTLSPMDESLKMSSSAVDTLSIFHQIKVFWQQLGWPDIEGSYMFVGKIVDDICQCCVFYANKMAERVESLGNVTTVYEKKFEVTREWCLAINNIDYIRQNLTAFVKELGVDDIIQRMSDYKSPAEAERCAATLRNVAENAIDTEKNKILELIETVAKKMSPQMKKFLLEGAEVLHEDSNSMDRLMLYMEESLTTLNAELNETNFQRILDAIWLELSIILLELVQTNLDKRRPPSFFQNLLKTLRLMTTSFKIPGSDATTDAADIQVLQQVTKLLELHGLETADLVHQYYKERVEEQKTINEPNMGVLTIQVYFNQNTLELEIMNARNLRPMDSSGTSDSYVRVNFIPEEKFTTVTKPKTNVQKSTLFPLYDEKFSVPLTPEQRAMSDAIIVFCVKETDMFGVSHRYNAECYLTFNEITDITGDVGKVQQILLPLTKPTKTAILESDCLRALELRQGDKQAKEFIKKLKQKINEK
uniref:CSON004614 protein n=1 Tax=Culicoides sonorensis TaxID=179676 RepID=A0A336MP88_CULSO